MFLRTVAMITNSWWSDKSLPSPDQWPEQDDLSINH